MRVGDLIGREGKRAYVSERDNIEMEEFILNMYAYLQYKYEYPLFHVQTMVPWLTSST